MELEQLKAKEQELLNAEPLDTVALKDVQDQITALEHTQAHEERVQQATTDFNNLLDNLDVSDGGGITLRMLIANEEYYQMAVIGIKGAFQAQADNFSKQIGDLTKASDDLHKANDELRAKLAKLADENADLNNQLGQEKLERAQAEQYRDNAADRIDELNATLEQKNGHIADLQDQIARGVQATIKTVNTEEDKKRQEEIAAKFKREHTVYDVVADDPLNPKNFTAKLAYNDQPVTYSWIAKNSYTELKSNDEVLSFRGQYPDMAQNDHADSPLDQPVPASVEPPQLEVPTFPEVPDSVTTDVVANEQQGVQQEGATLEERVAALENKVELIQRQLFSVTAPDQQVESVKAS